MKPKHKKSNKRLYIFLGASVVLLMAVGIIVKKNRKDEIAVEFAKAELQTITEKVNASGKIHPVNEVKLSSEVSGEIKELMVEEGDSVREGQLLAQIRPDNLRSAYDQAMANLNAQKANLAMSKASMSQNEAQLTQAKLAFERNTQLWNDKVISDQDYEQAKANYDIAQANLKSSNESVRASEFNVKSAEAMVADARESLALTKIFSPIDGVVTQLNIEQGETVVGTRQMANTEIMRIANLSHMEARVNVNENDIIRVTIGDTAIIDVDSYAYRDLKFKGKVTAIANSANNTANTDVVTEFEVKIQLLPESYLNLVKENKGRSPFRPGMTASVDIITEQKSDILSVPLSAVTTRKKEEKEGEKEKVDTQNDELIEVVFVHFPDSALVKQIEVKTGVSDFDNIEIIEGITIDEEVVKGPFRAVSEQLKDGSSVKQREGK